VGAKFLWINRNINVRALTQGCLKTTFGHSDSNMTVVLFVLASASLFGFTGYLFRDQIMSKRE
jgi:hypothetical protein